MRVLCMACLRLRWSPIHGLARLFGLCPGDKPHDPRTTPSV